MRPPPAFSTSARKSRTTALRVCAGAVSSEQRSNKDSSAAAFVVRNAGAATADRADATNARRDNLIFILLKSDGLAASDEGQRHVPATIFRFEHAHEDRPRWTSSGEAVGRVVAAGGRAIADRVRRDAGLAGLLAEIIRRTAKDFARRFIFALENLVF